MEYDFGREAGSRKTGERCGSVGKSGIGKTPLVGGLYYCRRRPGFVNSYPAAKSKSKIAANRFHNWSYDD
ncbi:hypothetical protein C5Y97_14155 [Blastopirellula marina]|uniref:Uncharacterized protein n=1 Tax=Blastopirellula marina TaxID=124 RepID=A0A2S8FTK4_9BACT|nr:hypothetical protein C5Y98_14145 [Blastopirellula marina]PQO41330.1 hypothetical protein C5Y93_29890 [Blastopirellula marina]PTL44136.1 hypothetical protein C5Y97_14155 [Blastopirellula marina]